MLEHHYTVLVIGYAVALAGWLALARRVPQLWPPRPPPGFADPWREFGLALLATLAVIGLGQLWVQGIRLPESGTLGPVLAAINQLLIFAPIPALVLWRRQPWSTAWLPRGHAIPRLLAGMILAALAVTAYSLLRAGAAAPWTMLDRIWAFDNVDELVQVFLEDVAIAVLFVRLAASIGPRWATALVALLFAAGHIPTMLSKGASGTELLALLRDVGLGIAVICVLQRARDVLWFWPVHFCMDMTQFDRITFGG